MPTSYASAKIFDPATADLMGAAFESAWLKLKEAGNVDSFEYRAEWARETLALRIIENAQLGERDVERLRDDALAHLAKATMPANIRVVSSSSAPRDKQLRLAES